MLTIPRNVLNHLHIDKSLKIFEVPVKLQKINMGMYWYKDLQENKRHQFLRSEINKIFT